MSKATTERARAIALLADRYSPKRRSGAKQLRRLGDPTAGPALLEALQREVQDPRTWETQYQLIMALAECRFGAALPLLKSLSLREFRAAMVYIALGDAIVRLDREQDNDPTPVLRMMESSNEMLIEGAFRAVAILHLQLNEEAVATIVRSVASRPLVDGLRFWVAAAAPGWNGQEVEAFLRSSSASPQEDIKKAAIAALNKVYLDWTIL